jgi:glucans biosynthesis protein C
MKINLTSEPASDRLYFLDWLRILAFSILLLEHCAEIFVTWGFWIKNPEVSAPLSYFVAFFKPWRMPLLFLVSGAAVTMAFKRKTSLTFIKERAIRLLLPLLSAMILVIPLQIYFIKAYRGNIQEPVAFLRLLLTFKWFPAGNFHWLHLWYLAYIMVFTVASIPLLQSLKTQKGKLLADKLTLLLSRPYILFSICLLMAMPYYFLETHALNQAAFYFPFFMLGALFGFPKTLSESFSKYAPTAFLLALGSTIILYYLSLKEGYTQPYFLSLAPIESFPVYVLKTFSTWFWLISILGYAYRFLNINSGLLRYATRAVYPFYILHQTVILAIAFFVVQLEGSIFYKLSLITGLSFGVIFLVYEYIIRRTVFTRVIFGLKAAERKEITLPGSDDGRTAAALGALGQKIIQITPILAQPTLPEITLQKEILKEPEKSDPLL